jgi:hypothetical protein
MIYELLNPSLALCKTFSKQFWAKALELARLYGWQPLGTRPTPGFDFSNLGADWLGTYMTNDGQVVSAEDAYALAAALERSLDDIPEARVEADWDVSLWLEVDLPEWFSPTERDLVEEELQDGLLDITGTSPLEFLRGTKSHIWFGSSAFVAWGVSRYCKSFPHYASIARPYFRVFPCNCVYV